MKRFWDKVSIGGLDDCWEWQGWVNKITGYGEYWMQGKNKKSHRVSALLSRGGIPEGMWVLHKCDNPKCVNPAHLFFGTPKDNAVDMIKKGRKAPTAGTLNGSAKLTEQQVINIRILYSKGGTSLSRLSAQFGVAFQTISDIILRKNWRHI